MRFIVAYSEEKDILNHLRSNWQFTYLKYGRKNIQQKLLKPYPKEFQENLQKAKTEKEAREVIKKFLDSLTQLKEKIKVKTEETERFLNKKSKEIIEILEFSYQRPFPFKEIIVYLTTANLNPYNFEQKWFMVNINSSPESLFIVAKHELNHLMFYYYYPSLKKELGTKKYEILKEALALFTNPEGTDKPEVRKLETYFKANLDKNIPFLINKVEWKKYLSSA